jgi:hypothetical protein
VASGALPRPSRPRPVRWLRLAASLAGALLALSAGWWTATDLGGRHPASIAVVLLLVPVLAVAVPTHRMEPLARAVLAVGWVLALNTVVAQVMLAFSVWDWPVGILVVTTLSVAVWSGVELLSWRSERTAAERPGGGRGRIVDVDVGHPEQLAPAEVVEDERTAEAPVDGART